MSDAEGILELQQFPLDAIVAGLLSTDQKEATVPADDLASNSREEGKDCCLPN